MPSSSFISLYPVAFAVATVLLVSGLCWWQSRRDWGRILAAVGLAQCVGYLFISRAMYNTDLLNPGQVLFAAVAVAITTKIAVFAPPLLARVTDPNLAPTFGWRHITVGITTAWLIQASLSLLYMFPREYLGNALVWMNPATRASAFVPLFLVGVFVEQVVMSGRVFEAADTTSTSTNDSTHGPSETATSTTTARTVPDGGCDD